MTKQSVTGTRQPHLSQAKFVLNIIAGIVFNATWTQNYTKCTRLCFRSWKTSPESPRTPGCVKTQQRRLRIKRPAKPRCLATFTTSNSRKTLLFAGCTPLPDLNEECLSSTLYYSTTCLDSSLPKHMPSYSARLTRSTVGQHLG